jgi:hypothetical protein
MNPPETKEWRSDGFVIAQQVHAGSWKVVYLGRTGKLPPPSHMPCPVHLSLSVSFVISSILKQ